MKKWEYLTIEVEKTKLGSGWTSGKEHTTEGWTQQLNKLGQEGWELINVIQEIRGVIEPFAIFKREIQGGS